MEGGKGGCAATAAGSEGKWTRDHSAPADQLAVVLRSTGANDACGFEKRDHQIGRVLEAAVFESELNGDGFAGIDAIIGWRATFSSQSQRVEHDRRGVGS